MPTLKMNRGTGAGGTNTNKNGLAYEVMTSLREHLNVIETVNTKRLSYEKYLINNREYIGLQKANLRRYLVSELNPQCERHLEPDEAFVCKDIKKLYILEKKFQQCAGSADEKIQTALFKHEFYQEQYPEYDIHYAYVLNDWFQQNKYKPEMRFLQKYGIRVFWSSDDDYVEQVKEWLL